MMVSLIFLTLLMLTFAGWLVSQSVNVQPWVAEGAGSASERPPTRWTGPRVGFAVFLAVATSVFAVTISAYTMRMAVAPIWQTLPEPFLLWVNTAVLLLGSVALEYANRGVKRGQPFALRVGMAGGAACAMAFILGQYLIYRQLSAEGYYVSATPASGFFVLLTALHAVHLFGGVVALTRALLKIRRGASYRWIREAVGLCALYWHYLFVVWVVLFVALFLGAMPLYALCR